MRIASCKVDNSFYLSPWVKLYSLSSDRLVDIKITKFYVEKIVPT
jgi:hypothetical protein